MLFTSHQSQIHQLEMEGVDKVFSHPLKEVCFKSTLSENKPLHLELGFNFFVIFFFLVKSLAWLMQQNKIGNNINYCEHKITVIDLICSEKGSFSEWRYSSVLCLF